MPSLAHFLWLRLFGTKRTATESVFVVGSFLLLLDLMPDVLQRVLQYLFLGTVLVSGYTVIGLYFFIIPGLIIALVGFSPLIYLLILFLRGCLHVAIRYLNWALRKYYLAQEDARLNNLFANNDPLHY